MKIKKISQPLARPIGLAWCFLAFSILTPADGLGSDSPSIKVVKKDSLEYQIFLRKEVYLLYEGIPASVSVKNISTKSITMYFSSWDGWVIKDNTGKQYTPSFQVGYLPSKIQPGDSLWGNTGLLDYGIRSDSAPHSYFPPGEYTVYFGPAGDKPSIAFRVIEPEGEQAEALKIYVDAFIPTVREDYITLPQDEKRRLRTEQVEKLQKVADRFPRSVYASQALLVSASRAWNLLNDDEKAYRIARRIISEYPEFGAEQIDVVKNYYILKQDTAGYVKELRSIIQQKAHPNLIEKARKALKEFEEKVEESPDTSGVIE